MAGCFAAAGKANPILAIAGAGLDIYGSLEQGKAQEEGFKRAAEATEDQARRTADIGAENVRDINRQFGEDLSSSRVGAAKSGIRVGAGSAGTAEKRLRRDYQRTAERYGKDVADRIRNLEIEAGNLRYQGKQARRSAAFAALGSGFGSAAKFAQYDWNAYFGGQ